VRRSRHLVSRPGCVEAPEVGPPLPARAGRGLG
jgi:hypothetical protein